jgi:hypothetical protein
LSKTLKTVLSLVQVILFVFNITLVYTEVFAATSEKYEVKNIIPEYWTDSAPANNELDRLKSVGLIPADTLAEITVQGQKMPFNFKLYRDLGLLVYVRDLYDERGKSDGKNRAPNKSDDDWCYGTQISTGNIDKNGGYFVDHSGKRGEYRYLGWDKNGNKITNINFINDETSTASLSSKDWLYKPWDSDSSVADRPTRSDSNFLAEALVVGDAAIKLQQNARYWINRTAPFTVDGIAPGNPGFHAYDYIHVQSPPLPNYPGSGRMWHKSRSTGKIWYQTFSIPTNDRPIIDVPLQVTIEIANKEDLKYNSDDSDKAKEQKVQVALKVTVKLDDEAVFNDPALRATYFTRDDIKAFKVKIDKIPEQTVLKTGNTGVLEISDDPNYNLSVAFIEALPNKTLTVSAHAEIIPVDTVKQVPAPADDTDSALFTKGIIQKKVNPVIPPAPAPPPPDIVLDDPFVPAVNVPDIAFDIVDFSATDNTDMSKVLERSVAVNGVPVDPDEFFGGHYVFGEPRVGFNLITIDYLHEVTGGTLGYQNGTITGELYKEYKNFRCVEWVYCYSTIPNAQFAASGSFKQNRKLTLTNTSTAGNVDLVVSRFPLVSYNWHITSPDGKNSSIKTAASSTDMQKDLLFKDPGVYKATLTAANTLGRTSKAYEFEFEILEDIKPAIITNLKSSVVARSEPVTTYEYSAVSTDGDIITSNSIEVWYDNGNDGTFDQKLQTYDAVAGFPTFIPAKLGNYKFVNHVTEDFGEPTLNEFITSADKLSITTETEFFVDNYIPMADIYSNIPIVRPQVDVFMMLDANLADTKAQYTLAGRMNFDNALRKFNLLSNVNTWDMRTYEYSQPASTTINSGSSYPSNSTSYTSNGYSGTLARTSASDNGSYHDFGHNESKTESKTASAGGQSTSGHGYSGSAPPSSVTYSGGDGYSGTLSGYGYQYSSTPCGHKPPHPASEGNFNWTRSYAGYSGTVSRTVSYWVPDVKWVANWYGSYSGTIYKYVRQPYTDPFRSTAKKYVIYISDGNASELADLKSVMSRCDAKLILIGQDSIKSQIAYSKFILHDKPIDQVINEALSIIAQETPAAEELTVLAGTDTFTIHTGNYDEEGDPIVEDKYLYVQDQNYYDNPTGMESYAVPSFNEFVAWIATKATQFTRTGEFRIYRRIKDQPSTDPAYSIFSYHSGTPQLIVKSHRKPIALATLDWDYDAAASAYKTTWVDKSYDLDHQLSRADKGIVERKIMYRRNGGEWYYAIPDNLSPGTYELQYYVKDPEGVWSDPFLMNFTLAAAPPMQFDAALRPVDSKFTLTAIPASESVQVYNAWTRYPYRVSLRLQLYKGAVQVGPTQDVAYSAATGNKTGNDIYWNPINYQIPAVLTNGACRLRVTAMGEFGQNAYKDFNLTVSTPIDLVPAINGKTSGAEVIAETDNTFTMTTSKYVTSVRFTFKGTTYSSDAGQIAVIGNDGTTKTWERVMNVPASQIADGETGVVNFRAALPSGEFQTADINYLGIAIRAYDFTVTSILDYAWRGYYFDLDHPIQQDGERYGYPKKTGTDIKTDKLPVNSLGLTPYTVDSIKAGCKVKGTVRIKGAPDNAAFTAYHTDTSSVQRSGSISLVHEGGELYSFSWIIPDNTQSDSYIRFAISIRKGASVYGNEKWYDPWAAANPSRYIFYIKGNVMEDIQFNQSH